MQSETYYSDHDINRIIEEMKPHHLRVRKICLTVITPLMAIMFFASSSSQQHSSMSPGIAMAIKVALTCFAMAYTYFLAVPQIERKKRRQLQGIKHIEESEEHLKVQYKHRTVDFPKHYFELYGENKEWRLFRCKGSTVFFVRKEDA